MTLVVVRSQSQARTTYEIAYILRCAADTLYVGHTEDLSSRVLFHNDGYGAVSHVKAIQTKLRIERAGVR